MNRKYSPFGKEINELQTADLVALREVEEGYFIEYKREMVKAKDIAKEVAAFANAYGGWIFIGIAEMAQSGSAGSFPGIPTGKAHSSREAVIRAIKANIDPLPNIETKQLDGPCMEVSLEEDRSIIAIRVLEGEEPPYIHNNGRVYRRHHANSDAEADRKALDDLYKKNERTKNRLAIKIQSAIDRQFTPQDVPRIKLLFISDPYGLKRIKSTFNYRDFSSIIRESSKRTGPYHFDNIFTESDGFIARQVYENSPLGFTLNWQYKNDCSSLVMAPFRPIEFSPDAQRHYKNLDRFIAMCQQKGKIEQHSIVDISILDGMVHSAVVQHKALLNHETNQEEKLGNYVYAKAFVEGFAGMIPFLDADCFIEHATMYGLPVVQADGFMTPPGAELEEMLQLELPKTDDIERKKKFRDESGLLTQCILEGLGIPPDLYKRKREEFSGASDRATVVHHTVRRED